MYSINYIIIYIYPYIYIFVCVHNMYVYIYIHYIYTVIYPMICHNISYCWCILCLCSPNTLGHSRRFSASLDIVSIEARLSTRKEEKTTYDLVRRAKHRTVWGTTIWLILKVDDLPMERGPQFVDKAWFEYPPLFMQQFADKNQFAVTKK